MITVIKETIKKNKLKIFYKVNRLKLKNKTPTIICNDCVAGVIYHELKLKFLSPTIDLWMKHSDYIKFVEHIIDYHKCEMLEEKNEYITYPVGILKNQKYGDIKLYFQHYETFEDAKEKWYERFARIDYNNMYIIYDVGSNIDPMIMKGFYALKNKNKIALVPPDYEGNQCQKISCYTKSWHPGQILEFNSITRKKYLHEWRYVDFLNKKA